MHKTESYNYLLSICSMAEAGFGTTTVASLNAWECDDHEKKNLRVGTKLRIYSYIIKNCSQNDTYIELVRWFTGNSFQ